MWMYDFEYRDIVAQRFQMIYYYEHIVEFFFWSTPLGVRFGVLCSPVSRLSPTRTKITSQLGMEPSSRMELDQTTSSRSPTRRPRRRRRTTPSSHSMRRIWKRRTTLDYVGSTTFTLKR